MPFSAFRNFFLIIVLIGGNAYAQTQLPKCVLFGFGNCIGTLRFSNGDIYTGEFNYGKPNGKGAFTYGNGDSYSGTVAEGQRHGSGTYSSAAGDKYVGQFSEGRFEGVGTYYFLANNRSKGDVYAGEFGSNTFNGQGRYAHANGQVFVGSFVNGRKAMPTLAPETLLVQAEDQRLLAENAKLKAQIDINIETEKGFRLALEKKETADRLTSESSLTKVEAKIDSASVSVTKDTSLSTEALVPSPRLKENPRQNSVPEPVEWSKWHLTAGLIASKVSDKVAAPCGSGCSSVSDDHRAFLGLEYDLSNNMGFEAKITLARSDSAREWINKSNLKNDYAVLMLGGIFSYPLSEQNQLNIGGGYRLIIDPSYSSKNSQSLDISTSDNPYMSLGLTHQLSPSVSIRLMWIKLSSSLSGITDGDGYEGLDLGFKYRF